MNADKFCELAAYPTMTDNLTSEAAFTPNRAMRHLPAGLGVWVCLFVLSNVTAIKLCNWGSHQ